MPNFMSRLSRTSIVLYRLAIAFIAILPGLAVGQWWPKRDPPPLSLSRVEFGWDGALVPERFSPVFVHLSSDDAAFAGELIIEYKQDATQRTRYTLPVSTTPGKTVPFELTACVPRQCNELDIIVRNQDVELIQRYRQFPREGELDMPAVDDAMVCVLLIGDVAGRIAFSSDNQPLESNPDTDSQNEDEAAPPPPPVTTWGMPSGSANNQVPLWKRAKAARRMPADLPRTWVSYQSLDLVVMNADDITAMDRRALDALLTWVDAGGRLLIIASSPGTSWRTILPPGPEGDLVQLGEPERVTLISTELARLSSLSRQTELPPFTLQARPVTITQEGAREGWTPIWSLDGESPRSIGAFGPRRFGLIAVLGADPTRVSPVSTLQLQRMLWREVFELVLPTAARLRTPDQYYWGGPYNDYSANIAHGLALDRITGTEPIGVGVFLLIAASMAALVVLVGPFDGLITRRRGLGSLAGLVAIGWIGLAGGLAYLSPSCARSGETHTTRFTIAETLCGPDGLPVRSSITGYTGIFGGKPGSLGVGDKRPGVWWRGVSAIHDAGSAARTFPPMAAPIRTELLDESEVKQAMPRAVTQGQWTFRTLLDLSPATFNAAAVSGRIARHEDGWSVTLFNVPENTIITDAELLIGGDLLSFGGEERGPGGLRLLRTSRPVPASQRAWVSTAAYWNWQQQQQTRRSAPQRFHTQQADLPHALPTTRNRVDAAEARVFRGEYALLHMTLSHQPDDVTLTGLESVSMRSLGIARLSMPVPRGDARYITRPTPEAVEASRRAGASLPSTESVSTIAPSIPTTPPESAEPERADDPSPR